MLRVGAPDGGTRFELILTDGTDDDCVFFSGQSVDVEVHVSMMEGK